MLNLPGYLIRSKIHVGTDTLIYSGIRNSDGAQVVVKVFKSELPRSRDLARLRHEYAILRNLDLPGVVKAQGIEKIGHGLGLVLEAIDGQSLERALRVQRLELKKALLITIELAKILDQLHAAGVIHKDLKPQNIVVRLDPLTVHLIDFGIAIRLTQETQQAATPGALEGTLTHMSPEQTGRMNRVIDARSDFYSLGVTLYEMLTGVLPFNAADSLELIHSHIAVSPRRPHEVDPAIPKVVSDIAMRLLAKAAEDRYQSGYGLAVDLQECLQQLQEKGRIDDFPLGRKDYSSELRIPQRLYGRSAEIAALLGAFERAGQGAAELLLVTGGAGVGKSVLVHEVHKAIARRGGFFTAGKFDQLNRAVPYESIAQALRELLRQVLSESEAALQKHREGLQAALGKNAQVLIELIPELELILGPQPPALTLGPSEAQSRFQRTLLSFVHVFATREHPLVLFLDDLQWADTASLKLLQLMLTEPERGHLLIIGAYRDNEVGDGHLLTLTLHELRKTRAAVSEISVQPLRLEHVAQLHADALTCDLEAVGPLAQLVYEKTQGNPLFVSQFLRVLHAEGLLTQDRTQGRWTWQLAAIEARQFHDDLLVILGERLGRMPESTQQILQLAACIGHQFELQTLALAAELLPTQVASALWAALLEGLVVPVDSEHRYVHDTSQPANAEFRVRYRFLHDRVQQSIYAQLPESRRQELHARIGRLLRGRADADTDLFDLVNHTNLGSALLTDRQEQLAVARLNLRAAQRAKQATAYQAAFGYFTTGLSLLGQADWEEEFELRFALTLGQAECEFLNGNFTAAAAIFEQLLARAKSVQDKLSVFYLRMALHSGLAEFPQTVKLGLQAMELLGVTFPEDPEAQGAALHAEIGAVLMLLGERSVESLSELPVNTDPRIDDLMHLAVCFIDGAYSFNFTLGLLVVTKLVHLSLVHGNTSWSAIAYTMYGAFVLSHMGRFRQAYEFGLLGQALNEKFANRRLQCQLDLFHGCFLHYYCRPVRECFSYFQRSLHVSLETGVLAFINYICVEQSIYKLAVGDELGLVLEEADQFLALQKRMSSDYAIACMQLIRQGLAALAKKTDTPVSLSSEGVDEGELLTRVLGFKAPVPACLYYYLKMELYYYQEDYGSALQMAKEAEKFLMGAAGMYQLVEVLFYCALVRTAVYPSASEEEKRGYDESLNATQAKFAAWVEGCPDNFQAKALLIAAEVARVRGAPMDAMSLYDQAIAAARAFAQPQVEALGNELCAKFYLGIGRTRFAMDYFTQAFHGYQHWGAVTKIEKIIELYAHLLHPTVQRFHEETATTSTRMLSGGLFDIASVLRATQAFSSEILLDNVLEQVMRIVLTSAGAERALLLLKGESYALAALLETGQEKVLLVQDETPETAALLPLAVVQYVARARSPLVIGNAGAEARFGSDPYIAARHPKSVLCLPLMHQGRVTGILYLENNRLTEAFSPYRVELLHLLASQAAISVENSRLYSHVQEVSSELQRANNDLEQQVNQRTEALRAATDELRASNERLQQRTAELRDANGRLQHELAQREQAEQSRAALQEEIIHAQKSRLDELSTPLIPITEKIVVMPLIGTMDRERAQQVMETALQGAERSRAQVVILDITGMKHMDTSVASTLINTAGALRMLGAQALLTGIHAEVAQTLVTLGVDLVGIVTRSTLQAGIVYALQQTGSAGLIAQQPASQKLLGKRRSPFGV